MANRVWPEVQLGDLVTVKHGWPFKSEYFTEFQNGEPIVVNIGNFNYTGGFRFDSTSLKGYRGNYPEEFILKPNDILLVMTCQTPGGEILGIPGRIPNDTRTYLHNQRLGKVVIKDPLRVDQAYLYWLFLSSDFNHHLVVTASGTKILHTSPGRIEEYRFKLPSLTEQRAIASILDTLEEKIELNHQMNKTLEMTAQALFKSWFVNFDQVKAKAESRKPEGMDDATAALFPSCFTASPSGLIPKGWTVDTLERVSFLNPENWSRINIPTQIEYVDLANTKWGTIESTQSLLWKDAPSRAQRILRKGDTIVGTVRPGNGSYAFISSDGLTGSTGFADLRPKKEFYQEFVYLSATSIESISRLTNLADGAAYPAVRPDVVHTTPILFPGDEILLCFSQCLSPVMEKIAINKEESNTLRNIRDLLLPRLISGKLHANDLPKEDTAS